MVSELMKKKIKSTAIFLIIVFIGFMTSLSAVKSENPFGALNPNNPFSEVSSPFGSLNPNNPFSEVSSPFGKFNPNNPFSEGDLSILGIPGLGN